ncbi:MAG: RrF2 family transcriptional regulator [Lachnospiraceae bacterium]|nr:RrF2 family transcriptional regulator [Lachnospiraceae bacterium]MCI9148888.1 RrF2 family transcriptional regulator [Lachnospiraceae bacterium]
MKISTKGRYALRLMLDLAQHECKEPVRLRDIAARQEISLKYLEQIISVLQKAGYVKSIRGPQGGYQLMQAPGAYILGDILRLIEGDLAPVACLERGAAPCERQGSCVTLRLWRELNAAICGVLDRYTLQDLMEWSGEGTLDYVI